MVDGDFSLADCRMCQERESGDVAAGIDVGQGSLHIFVYLHPVQIRFECERLETEALRNRTAADAEENLVAVQGGGAVGIFYRNLRAVYRCNLGAEVEFHTLFGIFGLQLGGKLAVHRA